MLRYASSFDFATVAALDADSSWDIGDPDYLRLVSPGWHARKALRITGVDKWARLTAPLSAGTETILLQAAVRFDSLSNPDRFLTVSGGGRCFELALSSDGGFAFRNTAGVAAGEAPAGTLLPGFWHYLEIKAQRGVHARVLVRVDGCVVLDLYDVDTKGSTYAPPSEVFLYAERNGTTWSELVVLDGLDAGQGGAELLGPSTRVVGDTAVQQRAAQVPNRLRELLGYFEVRAAAEPAARRRQTWRVQGAQLRDNAQLRVTELRAPMTVIVPALGADQTNWSPPGWSDADIVNIAATLQGRTLYGLDPWVRKPVKYLLNVSGYQVSLGYDAPSAPADSRIIRSADNNHTIESGTGCYLVRDPGSARWRTTMRDPFAPPIDPDSEPTNIIALL
jgi:hypothetical protein